MTDVLRRVSLKVQSPCAHVLVCLRYLNGSEMFAVPMARRSKYLQVAPPPPPPKKKEKKKKRNKRVDKKKKKKRKKKKKKKKKGGSLGSS